MLDMNTKVKVVIHGNITVVGIIVDYIVSGIDGIVYFIKDDAGNITEHADLFVYKR